MSLRVILTGLLSLLLTGPELALGQSDRERILEYHSRIEIQADASMIVVETLRVRSEQQRIRRGIYRDFPIRYRDRAGNRVQVDFEVLDVLRDGQPEPWFTERRPNGVRVNTGNDDVLPGPGEYSFTLRYRTDRQLGFFDQHDELYWNVTGLGWDFQIDRASAEVVLPAAVTAAEIRLDAYTGPAGSIESNARARVPRAGVAEFQTTQSLPPGHGLTIAVGFPKGLVDTPTAGQRVWWLVKDNRALLVLSLGGLAILGFYVRAWLTKGRGPAAGVIITRYEPPSGYSPAGLRYVMKKRHDQDGFTADLVALAVKGYVIINREDRLLGDRWSLIRGERPETHALPPSERALLRALFRDGPTTLELKQSNDTASRMQAILKAHGKAIKQRYQGRYIEPNHGALAIGWIASTALGVLTVVLAISSGMLFVLAGLVILLGINVLFTYLMPAPTEQGRALADHVEGFKRYLSVAEKADISRLEMPGQGAPALTPERYQQLLPYAMALDVESAWTDKFTRVVGRTLAEQTQRNLRWYTGSGAAAGSLAAMSSGLSKGLSSSIASASSPPGSSSGGGGGGFSGGGGGGGGGGGR